MANPSLIKQKLFPRALLLLTLILTCALQSRAGDTNVTIDNIKYTISGPNATVKGLADKSLTTDLVIPASIVYNNVSYSVKSIGERAFQGCTGLTSVTIDNSVTSISKSAFQNCTGLTSLTIPNSVIKIGEYAFWNCAGLTSLTIPNSVISIGASAFYNCGGLTSIIIGKSVTSIGNKAFDYCDKLVKGAYPNKVSNPFSKGVAVPYPTDDALIEDGVIWSSDKTKLYFVPVYYQGEFTIPDSVTSIGYAAFWGCTSLTSVIIPNSVTEIGEEAFWACRGLTSVDIPTSVTKIGEYAFHSCTGLTKVNITDLVAWCGISFNGTMSNPLSEANHLYLNGREITDLVIPDSVTSIGNSTFAGCTGLTSITIPTSVTVIWGGAFAGCTGLTSVIIPNSVTEIWQGAFEGCTGLTSVDIPNSVTWLSGFEGCTGLTSITIPNSVTFIASDAFDHCTGLTSVDIPTSVTWIGEYAFDHCTGLTSVIIPNSVTEIGLSAFEDCTGIAEIRFDDGSNDLKIHEDAFKNVWPTEIFFGRQMNLYQIATYSNLKAAEFGENVTSIETDAFETATELRSVTSRSSVPPRIVDPFNDNTYLWGTLYVPTESIDTYKSATGWRDFWEILSISDSGISEVDADGETQVSVEEGAICVDGDADVRIVSMNGTTVYSGRGETRINLTPGVYIVIINNTASKVAVK